MPLQGFICPDGEKVLIADCMSKCRINNRCAPMSWLIEASYDREWRGITASAAGNGIRMMYLKKNKPYYVTPDSRTFALISVNGVHQRMSKADFNMLTETRLPEGTADCLEQDEDEPGHFILTDYKLWGSYKVANGVEAVSADVAGKELRSETMQLNAYRLGFERNDFIISKMRLFCIARDGGTFLAKKRGLTRNTYFIELPRLADDLVRTYYETMKVRFEEAERYGFSPICSPEECWDGKRCTSFCDVADHCEAIGDNQYLINAKKVADIKERRKQHELNGNSAQTKSTKESA